jgi:palmitoyl transferase
MRRQFARLALIAAASAAPPAWALECADFWEWIDKGCRRVVDTYHNGSNQLLVSGYSWHTPWTWTAEKRAEENEFAYGAGWARAVERPNGDTDTVFFLVFADSHENAQFNLGYAWTTYWGEREKLQAGLGYTAMIIQRPDIASGVPQSRGRFCVHGLFLHGGIRVLPTASEESRGQGRTGAQRTPSVRGDLSAARMAARAGSRALSAPGVGAKSEAYRPR